jgi:uncharacterized repeat protein (TIGR03833 family)
MHRQPDAIGKSSDLFRKEITGMNGKNRRDIVPGNEVCVVLKKDQHTGKLTRGFVKDVLTRSAGHPHGIKVRLTDGQVGRVKKILSAIPDSGRLDF